MKYCNTIESRKLSYQGNLETYKNHVTVCSEGGICKHVTIEMLPW